MSRSSVHGENHTSGSERFSVRTFDLFWGLPFYWEECFKICFSVGIIFSIIVKPKKYKLEKYLRI